MNLVKNTPDVRDEEKNFVDFFITPFMKATMNPLDDLYSYESREAFLKSINTIWKNNGTIKSITEGYKADGIVRYKQVEVMLVEACGACQKYNLIVTKVSMHVWLCCILLQSNTNMPQLTLFTLKRYVKHC